MEGQLSCGKTENLDKVTRVCKLCGGLKGPLGGQ